MRPLRGRTVVAEYTTRLDADLGRARLADAGIESAVMGDPAHSVAPHLVVVRGFGLVVRDEVAEHARAILGTDAPPDLEAQVLDAQFHSHRFRDRPRWIRWAAVALVISVVGPAAVAALLEIVVVVGRMFP